MSLSKSETNRMFVRLAAISQRLVRAYAPKFHRSLGLGELGF